MQHLKDLSIAKKIELYTLLYEDLSGMGIDGDTELAHVNKEEMSVLRSMGGSGTVNPRTQLVQFMGGSSPPPAQASQTIRQEATIPDELAPFVTDILEKSKATQEERARKGFETIDGDRIAGFTPEQERAFEGISGLTGKGQEYFDKSEALTDRATAVPTSEEVGGLMSPYIQNVVNIQNREAQRAADIQQQKIDSAAVSAGGFGGSRHGIVEAEHFRNLATQKGDIQERGLAAAFEDAQTRLAQQRAREFQGASQISNLGVTAPGQATNEFRNLEAVGTQQQSQAQKNLNVAQQDFEIGRTFPERTLQDYNAIVRGFSAPIQASTNTNTQAFTPAPSFLSQAAGTGLAVAGIANAFKGGFKEGGLIGLYGGGQPQINSYKEGTGSYTIGAQPNQKPTARTGLLKFIQDNVFDRSRQDTYDQRVARIEEQRKLEAEKRQAERQALDTARNNAIQQQPVPAQPQQQQAALSQPVPPQNVSKFADGTGPHTIAGSPRGYDPRNIDNIIASLKDQIQNIASKGGSPRDLAFLQEQLNTAMTTKRQEEEAVRNEDATKRIQEDPNLPPPGNERPSRTEDVLSALYNQQANNKQAEEKYLDAEYAIGDGAGDPNRNEQTLNALATTKGRANDILRRDNVFAQEENALSEEGPPDNRNKRALDALATTQQTNADILRREKLYDSQENAFTGDGNAENLSRNREATINLQNRRERYKELAADVFNKEPKKEQESVGTAAGASRSASSVNVPIPSFPDNSTANVPAGNIISVANKIRELSNGTAAGLSRSASSVNVPIPTLPDNSTADDGGRNSASSVTVPIPTLPDNSTADDGGRNSASSVTVPIPPFPDDATATNPASVNNVRNGVVPDEFNSDQLAVAAVATNQSEGKVIDGVNTLSYKAPSSSTNTAFSNQLYDKWLAETAKQKGELTEQKAELGREKWMQVAKLGFSILSQPGGQTFLQTIGSGAVKSGFVDGLSKLTAEQRKLTNKIGSLNKEDLKVAFGLSDKQSLYAIEGRKIDNDLQKALLISGAKGPAAVKKARSAYAKHQDQNYNNKSGVQHFNSLFTQATKIDSLPQGLRAEAEKNGWDGWWKENYLERASVKEAFRVNIYKAREAGISESEVFKVATIKAFNAAKKDKMREGN
jgi:hypothetical protein